jgi:hypothetical protein
MRSPGDIPRPAGARPSVAVRDALANIAQVKAARERPMSERLELALSWNLVASQLHANLAAVKKPAHRS